MGGERGNGANSERGRSRFRNLWKPYSRVPLLGWFFGALVAVTLERLAGTPLAQFLGLQKIPVLFGFSVMLKNPVLIPNVILYTLIIYGVPTAVATRLCIPLANGIAASLFRFPMAVTAAAHLALLYAILHVWAEISDYRVLVLRLSLIENLEFVRGPRGLSGQPDWADLPTVFLWTVLCVCSINNFVRSTIGKALNAVRHNIVDAP